MLRASSRRLGGLQRRAYKLRSVHEEIGRLADELICAAVPTHGSKDRREGAEITGDSE